MAHELSRVIRVPEDPREHAWPTVEITLVGPDLTHQTGAIKFFTCPACSAMVAMGDPDHPYAVWHYEWHQWLKREAEKAQRITDQRISQATDPRLMPGHREMGE